MNDGKLVMLAGGISSRMKLPAAENLNIEEKLIQDADEKSKSMIGVGKDYRPFLDYLLFNARESGYRDIVLVIGENDYSIKKYYGGKERNNEFKGLKISYALQKIPAGRTKPLGTADALLCGLKSRPEWKGSRITVCNSDNLYSGKALTIMLNSNFYGALIDYDRSALEFDLERIEKFAVTIKDRNGFLIDILEKPDSKQLADIENRYGYVGVSMNIFALEYDLILPILETIPLHPERQEKELPEAVKLLAQKYESSVITYPLAEHVPDLTRKSDIIEVRKYLERYYSDISF
jgi:glucose-1-phosphate adenylyltransferase